MRPGSAEEILESSGACLLAVGDAREGGREGGLLSGPLCWSSGRGWISLSSLRRIGSRGIVDFDVARSYPRGLERGIGRSSMRRLVLTRRRVRRSLGGLDSS